MSSTPSPPDHYTRLDVDPSASRDEIRAAFRRLAKETHPDRNPGDPDAEARFRKIREARDVLLDPERRARYDARRQAGRAGAPSSITATSVAETGCVGYYLPRVAIGLVATVAFFALEVAGVWRMDDLQTLALAIGGASLVTGLIAVVILRLAPETADDYAVRFGADDLRVWHEQRMAARLPWTAIRAVTWDAARATLDLHLTPDAPVPSPTPPVLPDVEPGENGPRVRLDLSGTDVPTDALRQFLHAQPVDVQAT